MKNVNSASPTPELLWIEIPDLTFLIRRSQEGDRAAGAKLFNLAYPFLQKIAARVLRRASLERELAPEDLIHDAWLTRIRSRQAVINDRAHYIALLTMAMKGKLIDQVRQRNTLKRTSPAFPGNAGQPSPVSLGREDVLTLERELDRLEKIDPIPVKVVRLRYYGGCSWEETANALGITVKAARDECAFAERRLGVKLGRRSSL